MVYFYLLFNQPVETGGYRIVPSHPGLYNSHPTTIDADPQTFL